MKNNHINNHEDDCCCGHDHNHGHEELDESTDIEDYICDLDPSKICDNCMKCIDMYNTDDKGYVSIGIDGVDAKTGLTLQDLYKMYGLDDDDEHPTDR